MDAIVASYYNGVSVSQLARQSFLKQSVKRSVNEVLVLLVGGWTLVTLQSF
jgi:hypothetical protein